MLSYAVLMGKIGTFYMKIGNKKISFEQLLYGFLDMF